MRHGTRKIEPDLAWRRVTAQSSRMTGLVEDLLLLARLHDGRPLRSDEANLATLIVEALWALSSDHERRLALRLDGGRTTVIGDVSRHQQVMANLLANARAHIPPATRITMVAGTADARCVVRVSNDGPGIPPGFIPSVFECFTRADGSRSRARGTVGGSALGISIAAAIAEAHGGRIEIEGEPGRTESSNDAALDRSRRTLSDSTSSLVKCLSQD